MIRIVKLTTKAERAEAEALLHDCGLRLSPGLDALYGAWEDDALLGCGGFSGAVIRCVAVTEDARGTGVMSALVSQLVSDLKADGRERIFVFTKPESAPRFSELGFYLLAETPEAALLENRADGIGRWLASLPAPDASEAAAVVINGNPFTRGHRYLIERAAQACRRLYVFVLSEEASRFGAEQRISMARAALADLPNVSVLPGGPYCISRHTFPDYFLKRVDDAARVHAELDAALFASRIAPALHIRVRYAGSEPLDESTAAYNAAMARILPAYGIAFHQMERLTEDGAPVSASRLRKLLDAPDFSGAAALAPPTVRPYLIGQLAYEALCAEATATPKPGLVDRDNSGSHSDMNLTLLTKSAAALRPYFTRFAERGQAEAGLPLYGSLEALRILGVEAEEAMLAATNGINAHRGAIFTLGIFAYLAGRTESPTADGLCADAAALCEGLTSELPHSESHGGGAYAAYGARGVRGEAEDGYPALQHVALPAFAEQLAYGVPENEALTWTLLHLIAETEDTNLLHRGGVSGAAFAKAAAREFLAAHDPRDKTYLSALRALDKAFTRRNLSPGGAADLLAAAHFLYRLTA